MGRQSSTRSRSSSDGCSGTALGDADRSLGDRHAHGTSSSTSTERAAGARRRALAQRFVDSHDDDHPRRDRPLRRPSDQDSRGWLPRRVRGTGEGDPLRTRDGRRGPRHWASRYAPGSTQGECERRGDDLAGIAVNIAARIVAHAAAGEVLVSSTVRELVLGSGIEFVERGTYTLKGVPDEWHLFAVSG